jgi:hypothetical protein
VRTLEFRSIGHGDKNPLEDGPPDVYWSSVIRWLCPSLSEADAREVYDLGVSRLVPTDGDSLRRLITEWAATK